MLTPEYLEDLPEAVVKLYQEAEDAILADMARRIVNMDLFSPASVWQLKKLQEAGALTDDILEELSKRTHKTKAELRKLLQEAANISLDFDEGIYEDEGLMGDPLSASEPLRRILNAGYRKTLRTMQNLTGTTARTATQQFERALDKAWLKVNSGAFSSDQAVRDAVKELSERGVESITYRKNGRVTRTDTLEVATRRAVVTGVNQTCGELQIERAKELGADLMELSAHAGARPTHAEWQGKIVSLSGQPGYLSLDDIGYGDVTGFKGANCRHDWSPYFEGAPRTWTPEALAELNAKKYTYNGKEITQYEASQIQRKNERELRRWKREYKAMQAAGQDTSEAASKIAYWNKRQADFLEQTGFKRQQSREEIAGFTWKDQKAAGKQAAEREKEFTNAADDAIINEARAIDSLSVDNREATKYTPQEIFEELQTSPIGLQTIRHIRDSDARIFLDNEAPEGTERGYQQGEAIHLYLHNIGSRRIAGQTLIHEMAHYWYRIGNCQHAEAVCFAMEKMHILGRDYLTPDEWSQMVQLAVDNYADKKWEAGGYGDFTQFDFVRDG